MRSGNLWSGLAAVILAAGMMPVSLAQDAAAKHIVTRWAKDVSKESPWPEYPRPTMVREKWQNLNGPWLCSITVDDDKTNLGKWGAVLVPFPIQSALSGVQKIVSAKDTVRYKREFEVPADWKTGGQRVLLHFGAVDWHAKVKVNDKDVGEHKGGYDPFSFDITAALKDGKNQVLVEVRDPTDEGGQPRGKQWAKPHGIWYTPTTGIWQTVWMEPVSRVSIDRVEISTDISGRVKIKPVLRGAADGRVVVVTVDKVETKIVKPGETFEFSVKEPHLWSPDDPYLYDVKVNCVKWVDDHELPGAEPGDMVKTYFGIREVQMAKDSSGVNRLMLNGKPIFMFGPLDQGFWPDGIYTPPNEEAMKFDIEAVKKMGGNMLRKHVKVENERFYYWCDKMGVMVWQDIPSPFFKSDDPKPTDEGFVQPALSDEWKKNFEAEAFNIINSKRQHPSIVMWLPWNEGWGQNDLAWSKSVVEKIKAADPTRLVNCATGWTDTGNGDVFDQHLYPGPGMPPLQKDRAVVLGEYGGLGLPLKGHTWEENDKNWGYVSFKNKDELTAAYVNQIRQMPLLIGEGLCAAVYTQTTDVENECNGWLTYDREVWKIDPVKAAEASKAMYLPPPTVKVVVPRVGQAGGGGEWRYTFDTPPSDGAQWFMPGKDDSSWKKGTAGFGTKGTPGATIGTEWKTGDIWIRRTAAIAGPMKDPMLSIHHDEDAEVYINGELAAKLSGYTSGYQMTPVAGKAAEILKGIAASGATVTIAVHCHQTSGGQYIDVGLVDLMPAKP